MEIDAALTRRLAVLRRRLPTVTDMEMRAKRRIPRFVFDFLQGGAGDQSGRLRNRASLAAIQLVPRYGVDPARVDTSVELFGRRYAAPIGISPVGMDGLMWPGATRLLARAAQRHNIPYLTGTLATATIEEVAALAPDVTWFQLYPLAADDHRLSFDLADRAQRAGAKALVATLDVPARPKRPMDIRNGFVMPFRIRARNVLDVLRSPLWLAELARQGMPRFANIVPYAQGGDVAAFVGKHIGGGFSWEALARLRDRWQGPMLLKGILHPADAERAAQLGCDGVLVSNHGGRQFDAAPASIDMLPAVIAASGAMTVMLDSGITSGTDVLRAMALGAQGTFAGRAFMLGLAAGGKAGAEHVATSLIEEFGGALRQCGLASAAEAPGMMVQHPGRWPG